MQAATVSPVYIRALLKGAMSKGYNAEEILSAQKIPVEVLTNPRLRISTLAFAGLSRAVTSLLRDESMGLLARPTPIGSFRLTAKACLSSDNVLDSLQTWRDAINWLRHSSSAHTLFDSNGGFIAFECEKAPGVDDDYIVESQMTGCHRFHCWLANEFLPIERVDLAYPKPDHSAEHRFLFYGAAVSYEQKRNALHFSRKTLEHMNFRTRDELGELLSKPLDQLLTQPRQSNSLSIKLRLWMDRLFRDGGGLPMLEEAAVFLELSAPTLRRHLGREGYTFRQLKEDTRRDVAMQYITQSVLSVEDIGLRLGFADASSFIRSFKAWTGMTPLSYRKLYCASNAAEDCLTDR